MRTGTLDQARVRVQVVLGEATLTVKELAMVGRGTIVELESLAGEPVEFVAAGEVIAKGEVVIIDENFGIRITEMDEAAP